MIVRLKRPIGNVYREQLAIWVAEICLHESVDRTDYKIPYMPNFGDTTFWTVDRGNDIKLKFFDEDRTRIEIIHRYDIKKVKIGLANLIAYYWDGDVKNVYVSL
jgi:hypothetical protein